MSKKVLVVCTGNICRSPYGEFKLRQLLPDCIISSAGLDAEKNRLVGKHADSVAIRVAAESQIALRNHRARQLTDEMVEKNDVILVMEKKHMDAICDYFPALRYKVFMFSQPTDNADIEDPYKRGELSFRLAFNLIDDAAEGWMIKLRETNQCLISK